MIQSLNSPRAKLRYHQEGSRKLLDDYEVKRKALGDGYNGTVWLARSHSSKQRRSFALKSLPLDRGHYSSSVKEVQIHYSLDHPHIVQIVDVYTTGSKVHMVMEYMDGGDLCARMQKNPRFSEADAARIIRQVLLAVRYLHKNHIVHCDVKPENILSDSRHTHHKLTDFGFSTRWKEGAGPLYGMPGTWTYGAPEVLSNKSYTNRCDLWSVGVIAYTLLTGRPLFSHEEDVLDFRIQDLDLKHLSSDARSFVQALLQDERSRPTACGALGHSWLCRHEPQPDRPDVDGIIQRLRTFHGASQLKRTLCLISSLAPYGCHNDFYTLFMEMDNTGSGLVQPQDLKRVLQSGGLEITEEDHRILEDVFTRLDRDGDDYVRYSELLAAMRLVPECHTRACIDDMFRRFDATNEGHITRSNIEELLGQEEGSALEQELVELTGEAGNADQNARRYNPEHRIVLKERLARKPHPCTAGVICLMERVKDAVIPLLEARLPESRL
mmetsp:Transcript_46354/g.86979  ORF Transcript_46354/g.86979 Transcript_46354/m.86979 type:complete len:496 (-) Transcript_46354:64-1551(-)